MSIRPGSPRAWLLASRPATLTAAVVPVAVGAGVAHYLSAFDALPATLALLGAIWIQIGTNFANDVFDFKKGADTEERLGPTRAAQAGLLSPAQLGQGMFVAFGLATLCGIALTWLAGWPIIAIGIASVLSGIAYTGGPYPLGYNGLGDLFVMLFFGFVAVCGTVFVQMDAVPALGVWASLPVGSLATAILVVNNVRDADTDVLVGKRTLAVRLGRPAARLEYLLLVVTALVVPTVFAVRLDPLFLLPWVSAPLLARCSVTLLSTTDGPRLNACLKQSAIGLLVHGLLFALAFVLAA